MGEKTLSKLKSKKESERYTELADTASAGLKEKSYSYYDDYGSDSKKENFFRELQHTHNTYISENRQWRSLADALISSDDGQSLSNIRETVQESALNEFENQSKLDTEVLDDSQSGMIDKISDVYHINALNYISKAEKIKKLAEEIWPTKSEQADKSPADATSTNAQTTASSPQANTPATSPAAAQPAAISTPVSASTAAPAATAAPQEPVLSDSQNFAKFIIETLNGGNAETIDGAIAKTDTILRLIKGPSSKSEEQKARVEQIKDALTEKNKALGEELKSLDAQLKALSPPQAQKPTDASAPAAAQPSPAVAVQPAAPVLNSPAEAAQSVAASSVPAAATQAPVPASITPVVAAQPSAFPPAAVPAESLPAAVPASPAAKVEDTRKTQLEKEISSLNKQTKLIETELSMLDYSELEANKQRYDERMDALKKQKTDRLTETDDNKSDSLKLTRKLFKKLGFDADSDESIDVLDLGSVKNLIDGLSELKFHDSTEISYYLKEISKLLSDSGPMLESYADSDTIRGNQLRLDFIDSFEQTTRDTLKNIRNKLNPQKSVGAYDKACIIGLSQFLRSHEDPELNRTDLAAKQEHNLNEQRKKVGGPMNDKKDKSLNDVKDIVEDFSSYYGNIIENFQGNLDSLAKQLGSLPSNHPLAPHAQKLLDEIRRKSGYESKIRDLRIVMKSFGIICFLLSQQSTSKSGNNNSFYSSHIEKYATDTSAVYDKMRTTLNEGVRQKENYKTWETGFKEDFKNVKNIRITNDDARAFFEILRKFLENKNKIFNEKQKDDIADIIIKLAKNKINNVSDLLDQLFKGNDQQELHFFKNNGIIYPPKP